MKGMTLLSGWENSYVIGRLVSRRSDWKPIICPPAAMKRFRCRGVARPEVLRLLRVYCANPEVGEGGWHWLYRY
jgi:hypothetical protein